MVAVGAMLAVDLFLHRDNHVIGFREAAVWSAVWVAAGLAFGLVLWFWQGGDMAGEYYAGYLIEKALSIDNVFVFALIFTHFAVPDAFQHKVLFWGVLSALALRFAFIFVGAGLLETFFWTAYVFGAFLIYTGYKMAFSTGRRPSRTRTRWSAWCGGWSPPTRTITAPRSSPRSTASAWPPCCSSC